MIKITYTIFPRPDLTAEEARGRWLDDHGALMRKHAKTLRVVRYVQTPRIADPIEETMAAARGIESPAPLGMAEIYWASRQDLEASYTDAAGRRAYRELVEDEKRFAAWTMSSPWVGTEREVFAEEAYS